MLTVLSAAPTGNVTKFSLNFNLMKRNGATDFIY